MTARRIATALGALVLAACGPGDAQEPVSAAGPLAVESRTVEQSDGYTVVERFAGRVVARRTSDLGFERGGRVVEVAVDLGDRVEAGDVLARLETRELLAERRELEARLAEANARLALAKLTTERRRRMVEEQSVSEQVYDEARFEEQAIASQLEAARAGIERIDVALELSRIEAPYAGSVIERQVDEGTVVAPGQTLLRLIEDEHLELRVGVPPETAAALERDRAYDVEVDGRSVPSRLDRLLENVEPDTRTVVAVFQFEEAPDGVRSGALARLEILAERPAPGFWLPLTALAESRRGLWSAFALVPPEEDAPDDVRVAERRELQVIHAEADRAYVRGTLGDGERVVASGLHRLVPGQRVRVVR